jgi:hypothetical protein
MGVLGQDIEQIPDAPRNDGGDTESRASITSASVLASIALIAWLIFLGLMAWRVLPKVIEWFTVE